MLLLNHDIHIHTYLSACCNDKTNQVPDKILKYAFQTGLHTVGFSDHIWSIPLLRHLNGIRSRMQARLIKLSRTFFPHFLLLKYFLDAKLKL